MNKNQAHHVLRKLYRLEHERFYISFSLGNSYNPATGRWTNGVWPKLFKSEEAAQLVIDRFPVFANKGPVAGRGKIKSVCIERVLVKR